MSRSNPRSSPVWPQRLRKKARPPTSWPTRRRSDSERIAAAVETLGSITKRTAPTEALDIVKTDPDDNRVVECAPAAASEFIVSGDAELLWLAVRRGITCV